MSVVEDIIHLNAVIVPPVEWFERSDRPITNSQKMLSALLNVVDPFKKRQQLLLHPFRYCVGIENVLQSLCAFFCQCVEGSGQIRKFAGQFVDPGRTAETVADVVVRQPTPLPCCGINIFSDLERKF